jgi:hypothetical protein
MDSHPDSIADDLEEDWPASVDWGAVAGLILEYTVMASPPKRRGRTTSLRSDPVEAGEAQAAASPEVGTPRDDTSHDDEYATS